MACRRVRGWRLMIGAEPSHNVVMDEISPVTAGGVVGEAPLDIYATTGAAAAIASYAI